MRQRTTSQETANSTSTTALPDPNRKLAVALAALVLSAGMGAGMTLATEAHGKPRVVSNGNCDYTPTYCTFPDP